jgi:hypothetical protein
LPKRTLKRDTGLRRVAAYPREEEYAFKNKKAVKVCLLA